MKQRFWIALVYDDESETGFYVEVEGADHQIKALLSMITRGTLMASMAYRATCYNSEGFDVCSYQK